MLEFGILGTLEAAHDGRTIALGGARQRALLALLLINRRRAVSSDRLAEELWNGQPPATAAKSIQVYVSQLRKLIGHDALLTRGGGYELVADRDQVDADRFEDLVAEGRHAREADGPAAAARFLRQALGLWRGTALGDFAYEEVRPAGDPAARGGAPRGARGSGRG